MLVHRRLTRASVKFSVTHLHTWVERHTDKAKCLAQEHNTMSPARARTRIPRSGGERTNHWAPTSFPGSLILPPPGEVVEPPRLQQCTNKNLKIFYQKHLCTAVYLNTIKWAWKSVEIPARKNEREWLITLYFDLHSLARDNTKTVHSNVTEFTWRKQGWSNSSIQLDKHHLHVT